MPPSLPLRRKEKKKKGALIHPGSRRGGGSQKIFLILLNRGRKGGKWGMTTTFLISRRVDKGKKGKAGSPEASAFISPRRKKKGRGKIPPSNLKRKGKGEKKKGGRILAEGAVERELDSRACSLPGRKKGKERVLFCVVLANKEGDFREESIEQDRRRCPKKKKGGGNSKKKEGSFLYESYRPASR